MSFDEKGAHDVSMAWYPDKVLYTNFEFKKILKEDQQDFTKLPRSEHVVIK